MRGITMCSLPNAHIFLHVLFTCKHLFNSSSPPMLSSLSICQPDSLKFAINLPFQSCLISFVKVLNHSYFGASQPLISPLWWPSQVTKVMEY